MTINKGMFRYIQKQYGKLPERPLQNIARSGI